MSKGGEAENKIVISWVRLLPLGSLDTCLLLRIKDHYYIHDTHVILYTTLLPPNERQFSI